MIISKSKRDPRQSARVISKELAEENHIILSNRTVRKGLQKSGLHGRRPSKKPLINAGNRRARLDRKKSY